MRRAFVARDVGPDPYLLSADYSQIELRIMAHITDDPALVEAFRNDEDIHAATASQVFGVPLAEVTRPMRRRAKVFNFGVLYGLSDFGLAVRERITREEAATFIRTYFEKYPGIKRYVEETVAADAASWATRRRCSGGGATSRRSTPATSTCARPPSARRSTCRCRARPPTSSRSR